LQLKRSGVLPGMRKFVRPGTGDVKDFDIWLLQPIGSGQTVARPASRGSETLGSSRIEMSR
jgi:hypothetical protein